MSRFVKPETCTLTLANGDRITVKKQLTCGEQRRAHDRLYVQMADGRLRVNPLQVGISTIVAYLVDWTLTDDDGQLVPIRGLAPDDLESIIDALDVTSFAEIREAIDAHETAILAAREEKKTPPTTAPASEAISISVN
jgi:hypothetical protein